MPTLGPEDSPGQVLAVRVQQLDKLMDEIIDLPPGRICLAVLLPEIRASRPEARRAAVDLAHILNSRNYDTELRAVGFTPDSGSPKIRGFDESHGRVRRFLERIRTAGSPIEDLPPAEWDWLRERVLSFLKWANLLLKSIFAAMPVVPAAELLTEAKETLERAIEDSAMLAREPFGMP